MTKENHEQDFLSTYECQLGRMILFYVKSVIVLKRKPQTSKNQYHLLKDYT